VSLFRTVVTEACISHCPQDAGLIFLSAMSGNIANAMLAENATEEEILSTVLVLLAVGTATLGVVLILMGHFRLAEYVLL